MENLNQYIKEALVNHKIKSKYNYKYHPKTKDELIEYIQTELKDGNIDLNCIDTSKITDMALVFDQEEGIKLTKEQQETLDISEWNVSNVKYMEFMFFGCSQFNCDLSNWNVSKVKNMRSMFEDCYQFNSDLSQWDVSNVESIVCMFSYCERFNSDLSKWDVSNVENMRSMFDNSGLEGNEPSWYKN